METTAESRGGEGRFYGRFRLKLDAKGRVTLPSVYRRALGLKPAEGDAPREETLLVLRKGAEGFVQIIPYDTWDRIVDQQQSQSAATGRERQWQARRQYSGVEIAGLDPKGRLTVPQSLIESGGLVGDVLVIGAKKLMEIWNPETYFSLEAQAPEEDESLDDELYA